MLYITAIEYDCFFVNVLFPATPHHPAVFQPVMWTKQNNFSVLKLMLILMSAGQGPVPCLKNVRPKNGLGHCLRLGTEPNPALDG